jgi:hypothetical protein
MERSAIRGFRPRSDIFPDYASLHPGYGQFPYRTTPEVNPALRRGGLMSLFRKQRAALPA